MSVISFSSSIMPMMKSSWTSRREPPRRACFAVDNQPARAFAIQAMATEIPIPNRAAAGRADIPSRDAASTRLRRSSLKVRVCASNQTTSPSDEIRIPQSRDPQYDSAFNRRAIVQASRLSADRRHSIRRTKVRLRNNRTSRRYDVGLQASAQAGP